MGLITALVPASDDQIVQPATLTESDRNSCVHSLWTYEDRRLASGDFFPRKPAGTNKIKRAKVLKMNRTRWGGGLVENIVSPFEQSPRIVTSIKFINP